MMKSILWLSLSLMTANEDTQDRQVKGATSIKIPEHPSVPRLDRVCILNGNPLAHESGGPSQA
jgi:hypothetical protein